MGYIGHNACLVRVLSFCFIAFLKHFLILYYYHLTFPPAIVEQWAPTAYCCLGTWGLEFGDSNPDPATVKPIPKTHCVSPSQTDTVMAVLHHWQQYTLMTQLFSMPFISYFLPSVSPLPVAGSVFGRQGDSGSDGDDETQLKFYTEQHRGRRRSRGETGEGLGVSVCVCVR